MVNYRPVESRSRGVFAMPHVHHSAVAGSIAGLAVVLSLASTSPLYAQARPARPAARSAAPAAAAAAAAPGAAAAPVAGVFQSGDAVEVREGDTWSAATVLKKEGRKIQIKYADGGTEEWVTADRVR